MNTIYHGIVKKGQLWITLRKEFDDYVRSLDGKTVEIVLRLPKKGRSTQQNRYYFGVVVRLVSESTGYTTDEAHDALRLMFLSDNSRAIPTIRSTTALSTKEFEEYIEKIKVWAAETLNCYIPDPSSVE